MSRGRYSRGTRGWKHELMNGAAAAAAPEQHYLPFDGVTDRAYSTDALQGIGTSYTFALKVERPSTASSGYHCYGGVWVDNVTARPRHAFYKAPGTASYWQGLAAASLAYSSANPAAALNVEHLVFAWRVTGTTAKLRICNAAGVVYTEDIAGLTFEAPRHFAIGNEANCETGAAGAYPCDVHWIASIAAAGAVSDADLAAWAGARDARTVITGLYHYAVASSAVAGSVPSLVGTAPITLSGPVAGDLVALPAAVTSYYSSPGGAGDYAEASSNVAARVLVPVGASADCTFASWVRADSAWGDLFRVDDGAAGGPGWTSYNDGDPALGLVDDAGNEDVTAYFTSPATGTWVRVAYVLDAGATIKTYIDGVEVDSQSVAGWTPVTLGATAFRLFKSLSGFATDQRAVIINDRAHTAGEEAALYAAGETHNPLAGTGAWAGGQSIPVVWCTAAVVGVVANSGDGGTCNLVLSGAVTSLEDA